ncbi:MAG: glycosyltransferase family 39 protein [Anaerolineae bacterium]|nr:glycosyltransferase family 39 protein [Anaerolineae bacterium]
MNTQTRTSPRWTFYAMLAVLLVASYTRIHDLNAQGLWGDEGWSIWLARGDSVRDLTMTMVADHHGPEYSVMLRAWDTLVGGTVVALRYEAVLFSIASIALIYRLGRELFSPAAGVWAALAFTLMDKHVVLTQEVRDYPMVFFYMIAIALLYVRWRRWPTGGHAFGFVLFSVLGLYLHYYCYMVNLAILVHALITLRGRTGWRHFIALNALVGLAFLPWVPIVIHQFIITPVDSEVLNIHGMPFNRATLEYLAVESLGQPVALYGLLMLVGGLGPLASTPGPMGRVPRERRLSGTLLAALWFGVPIIITAALHSRFPLLTDRNISVIMPAVALLVGHGLTAFDRFGAAWVITLMLVNGLFTTSSYFEKPPWRELAADVAAVYPGDEPVLVDVEGAHAALWYHLTLALPDEAHDEIISLYDYRKRFKGYFLPHVKAELLDTDGLWMAYWGDADKKHDVFDLLEHEGFTRTGTLTYEHLGFPIYAYRYDRVTALQDEIVRFGDVITLRKVDLPESLRPGDPAPVLLWWHAEQPPGVDYSVSVFLLDAGGVLRAQHDSYPANGTAPTGGWQPGTYIFDGHTLDLPDDLPPGVYSVGVKLYTYWDGAVLLTADGAEYAVVGTLAVE